MAEQIGQMLLKAAREMGAEDLRLEHGGKHPRVTGRIGERTFKYVVPGSCSDWRAGRNALSGLRRLLGYQRPQAETKDRSGRVQRRKRKKARNRISRTSSTLLANDSTAPKGQHEDRFHARLAVLAEQMRATDNQEEPTLPSTPTHQDSAKAGAPCKRVPLRTPWLGQKRRFQAI